MLCFVKPFTNMSVDYGGGRILRFVCISTKSVHLKIALDLSTNCFLAVRTMWFYRLNLNPNLLQIASGKEAKH